MTSQTLQIAGGEKNEAVLQINTISIMVLDQDEARDFYVTTLGLEVANDVRKGDYRYLTVRVSGDPSIEIFLEEPGPPVHDEATAGQLRELISKGAMRIVFRTDDCGKLYETLKARGVTDFIQEPSEHEYGIDMRIRDPFGNHVRILQPRANSVPSR